MVRIPRSLGSLYIPSRARVIGNSIIDHRSIRLFALSSSNGQDRWGPEDHYWDHIWTLREHGFLYYAVDSGSRMVQKPVLKWTILGSSIDRSGSRPLK